MKCTPEVRAIIEKLAAHRPGADMDLTAASDCVEELFASLGTEDIGEPTAQAVEAQWLSEEQGHWVLGVATWSGCTNGGDLQPTLERWLREAQNPLRIALALEQDAFPFRDLETMAAVLTNLTTRHPQFGDLSRRLIESRRRQCV